MAKYLCAGKYKENKTLCCLINPKFTCNVCGLRLSAFRGSDDGYYQLMFERGEIDRPDEKSCCEKQRSTGSLLHRW